MNSLLPVLFQPKPDTIYNFDALQLLRLLPDESVNCCVSSPPYFGLRSYLEDDAREIGKEPTPEEYVTALVTVFRELRRVLRSDGAFWLNIGDSYSTHAAGKVDDPFATSGLAGTRTAAVARQVKVNQSNYRNSTLPEKNRMMIPARLAIALQDDGWYLRDEIVWHKCLSGGTRVYAKTQKGEMPMTIKDLVRLRPETVKLWNGEKWTQVVSWQETPRPEHVAEVALRSGERIGCTLNHRWPTHRGVVRTDELQAGDIITTCSLPEPELPKSPAMLDDEIVGWFVGLYIAEGSKSDTTIQISGHIKETERFERLCQIAEMYHGTCRVHHVGGNNAPIHLYGPILEGILDAYVSGRTAHDKHLDIRCWQRSNRFLRAVLDGYLSGDGHYDAINNRWRIGFTDNTNLVCDLRTLCARLGIRLKLVRTKHTMAGRKFDGWRGEIRFENSSHHNAKYASEVVAIRRSRAMRLYDICVEDDPHLFALASGVLTHNSNPMPASVTDRTTTAHEMIYLLTKKPRYWYDAEAVAEPAVGAGGGDFMPALKAIQPEHGGESRTGKWARSNRPQEPTRNRRSVWTINPEPLAAAHFAVMPSKLVEICVLAGCPPRVCSACGAPYQRVVEKPDMSKRPTRAANAKTMTDELHVSNGWAGYPKSAGQKYQEWRNANPNVTLGWKPTCDCHAPHDSGIVIDPFMGAGTVALVAQRLNRHFIGSDLNPEYVRMATMRVQGRLDEYLAEQRGEPHTAYMFAEEGSVA